VAKILAFRPAALEREDSGCAASEGASAEVIVFPGVRYEHWENSCEARLRSSKMQKGGAQRDRLELVD